MVGCLIFAARSAREACDPRAPERLDTGGGKVGCRCVGSPTHHPRLRKERVRGVCCRTLIVVTGGLEKGKVTGEGREGGRERREGVRESHLSDLQAERGVREERAKDPQIPSRNRN